MLREGMVRILIVPRRIRLAMKCGDVDDFAALSNYHMYSTINIVYQKTDVHDT
jgi:hypothetical protein